MKEGGTLLYKCRLCGETKGNTHAPHLLICLAHLLGGHNQPEKWGPMPVTMNSLHSCKDGRLGVSDLVGGEHDT